MIYVKKKNLDLMYYIINVILIYFKFFYNIIKTVYITINFYKSKINIYYG